jgi:hypothetical protein
LSRARGIHIAGKYAYTASNNNFVIIDVSAPSSPAIIGNISDSLLSGAHYVHVSGRYAYLTSDANRLVVIDVSNKTSPVIKGSVTDTRLDGIHDVHISGKYAYVSIQQRFSERNRRHGSISAKNNQFIERPAARRRARHLCIGQICVHCCNAQ